MSSSREESPDWLRSFQAPTASMASLSSLSKSSADDSPFRESETISSPLWRGDGHAMVPDENAHKSRSTKNSKTKLVKHQVKIEQAFSRKKRAENSPKIGGKQEREKFEREEISGKHMEAQLELDRSVLILSSDSEPGSDSPIRELPTEVSEKDEEVIREPTVKKASIAKSPKKESKGGRTSNKENSAKGIGKSKDRDSDVEIAKEETSEKNIKPCVSTSRLPLVLSEKVNRSKALVECEGDSIDLSGDMGAVGRVVVSDTTHEVYLDLKGTIYKTTIVPSRTFCVVSVGQSEAKIEAIMDDFIQLKPQSNGYEAETMVEGTLEGFSFESEDEGDKNPKAARQPTDQSEGTKEQTNTKASVSGKKRGRPAKEKPQPAKKPRKKSTAPKKTKAKK